MREINFLSDWSKPLEKLMNKPASLCEGAVSMPSSIAAQLRGKGDGRGAAYRMYLKLQKQRYPNMTDAELAEQYPAFVERMDRECDRYLTMTMSQAMTLPPGQVWKGVFRAARWQWLTRIRPSLRR